MTQIDAVKERLAELYETHGHLTPDIVLEDAHDKTSPLHGEFQWDNKLAAHQYRLQQARELIRSVKVTIVTDTVSIKTVQYVRDPNADTREQGYVSVDSLRSDPRSARDALIYECGRAAALLERSRDLAMAVGLIAELDGLLAGIGAIRERAAA